VQSGPRFLRLGIQMLYDALDELRVARCRRLRFSSSTAMPRIEKPPRRSPRITGAGSTARAFASALTQPPAH
jgi:hypothetical protein